MDLYVAYHVFIKLVIGGLNYLMAKLTLQAFEKESNLPGGLQLGKVPMMMTFSTFLSLFIVALPVFFREWRSAHSKSQSVQDWKTHGVIAIAGILELVAVYLSMFANGYLPASMLVFMKATRVFWSALLSKHVLKRKLYGHHWVGVALTFIGLLPIFAVSLIKGKSKEESAIKQVIAFIAVFGCEFFRAVRIIMEERQLKDKGVSPAFVQYVEGYAGLFVCLAAMPIFAATGQEKIVESFQMMGRSERVGVTSLFVVHTIAHGLVNYSSTVVTKLLSSVHNAIISEMRILVVWAPEFIIGACFNEMKGIEKVAIYGKLWHPLYLCDIPGFAIIVASAFIYNGNLRLPFKSLYPAEKSTETVSPSTDDARVAAQ